MSLQDNKGKLTNIIDLFSIENDKKMKGVEIELEIRFRGVTKEIFTTIYEAVIKDSSFVTPALDCSVNILSSNMTELSRKSQSQQIYRIQYNAVKPTISYWRKTKLTYPVVIGDVFSYTVNLSIEEPIEKFPVDKNSTLRFKNRISFFIHPWRLDLTAVKKVAFDVVKEELGTLREQLCTGTKDITRYLADMNFTHMNLFEIELEYVGEPDDIQLQDFLIVNKLMNMMHPKAVSDMMYKEEILALARYLYPPKVISQLFDRPFKIRSILNKAIAINKAIYWDRVYPPTGYYLTDKANGERAVLVINGNRCRLLFESSIEEISSTEEWKAGHVTIADCEYMKEEHMLYVFDCLVITNTPIVNVAFADRVSHLNSVAQQVNSIPGIKMKCIPKEYVLITNTNLEGAIKMVYNKKRTYKIDGLIFVTPDAGYLHTRNYKWKPHEFNTIDFLAVKCPIVLLGAAPYTSKPNHTLYLLFCGINQKVQRELGIGIIKEHREVFADKMFNAIDIHGEYFPIQFSSTIDPLAYLYYHHNDREDINGKIVELGRDTNNEEWIFHHVRTDRTMSQTDFGNNFQVAELTFVNYVDHFNLEDLYGSNTSYFAKVSTAKSIHKAQKGFMRFVISSLLEKMFVGNKYIVDLASGRGADIHRYEDIGVEHLLCTDNDSGAIAELIRKRFDFEKYKKDHAKRTGGAINDSDPTIELDYEKIFIKTVAAMTVHATVVDLKLPYTTLLNITSEFGIHAGIVNGVICNFAFHYMCDTMVNLQNILTYVSKALTLGGRFMFVVMSGEAIFKMIENIETGQQWQSWENGVIKYAIKKLYTNKKIDKTGQMISVLLPFSDKMYDEPLCNIDVVLREAKKLCLVPIVNESFIQHIPRFEKLVPAMFKQLTEEDKKYIALFRYVILEKKTRTAIDNEY